MPLLDHFHPPLRTRRHWEGFHGRWASAIADALNEKLPAGYFAEPQVSVGGRVEVDVGAFDPERNSLAARVGEDEQGGIVTAPVTPWAPPAPRMSMPAIFPDS